MFGVEWLYSVTANGRPKIRPGMMKPGAHAFLDIVDTAIRVKDSSKDDDIIAYSLAFEHFELCNNSQVFICTSQNAYKGLIKIIENPKVNIDKSKIFICYQDRFHYNFLDWQQKLC